MDINKILKRLTSYFLQGILYSVPLGVTLYVIYRLFNFIDHIIEVDIPGLGFVILLFVITLIGFLGTTILAQPIISYFQSLLDKAPLLKTIYSALKDLLSAFVGKKKTFDQPVLVKLSRESNIEKLGFVTSTDLTDMGMSPSKVAVYLPHSYNFSGNLFIVESENITPIDAKSADVMKFIVSGGVAKINNEQHNHHES